MHIDWENSHFNVNFILGSVTAYNAKMENVHCSPTQHMVVKKKLQVNK